MRTGSLIYGISLAASMAVAQDLEQPLTFSHDVAPILYQHCVSCHHPGDIAPMSLLTYKDARPWAAAIREAVVSRKMPPWLADSTVGRWSNDPRFRRRDPDDSRLGVRLEGGRRSQRHATNIRWGSASENEMMDGWIEYLDATPGVRSAAVRLP